MKKLLFINLLLICSASFGQDFKEMNKWSVGASIGGHDALYPSNLRTKIYQVHHFGANGRYMLNNRFGLMADLGYDFIDAYKSGKSNVNYLRLSVQGVANLGDVLRLNSLSSNLGLLAHVGGGYSTMWCPNLKKSNADDPFIKNTDDMVNIIFGLTPQYKLTERISLNADISMIVHGRQNYTFDYSNSKLYAINGYLINWSIGASYYIGKKEKHADWVSTSYGEAPKVDNSKYDELIKELQEKVKDDDADGVPNYVDAEPATPKNTYVDSKGIALKDKDNDGIADEYDLCPDVKGTFSMNGCLDTDGDGISDNNDGCPKFKGLIVDNGCPFVPKEIKKIMEKALKGVQFETNKDVLLKSSYASLNEVVKVMNANTSYKLRIDGHTDNVGNDDANMLLSQKRAMACAQYLISKGIASDRFNINGYGETKPIASNDTKEGKALNRRVEFTVIFE